MVQVTKDNLDDQLFQSEYCLSFYLY